MAAASIGDAKKQRSAEGVDGWTPGPQALLLDVQGVLVDNGVALAGAVHTVREARRRGLAIRLLTNTATRHHAQLLQELRSLGFGLEAEELFTAPLAAQRWLQRHQLRPLALVHPAIAPLFQGLEGEEGAGQSGGRPQPPLPGRRPLAVGCRGLSAGP